MVGLINLFDEELLIAGSPCDCDSCDSSTCDCDSSDCMCDTD